MERIKVRQQKFKRGKEKMLSMAQESGDGQTLVQPEDDDDDGMMKPARAPHCAVKVKKVCVEVIWWLVDLKEGGWECVKANQLN